MPLLPLLIASLLVATAGAQKYVIYYEIEDGEVSAQAATVDESAQTICVDITGTETVNDAKRLEDYETGFAATIVDGQEACYITGLQNTLEEQVAFLENNNGSTLPAETGEQALAVDLENPEEVIGERLTEFCGDRQILQLVQSEGRDVDDGEGEDVNRQVSVTITKCFFICFIPKCFSTTLVIPTGVLPIFTFLFG